MLRALTPVIYPNSKCAEIHYKDRKQFSIICSYCNLATRNYKQFQTHFNKTHRGSIETLEEEAINLESTTQISSIGATNYTGKLLSATQEIKSEQADIEPAEVETICVESQHVKAERNSDDDDDEPLIKIVLKAETEKENALKQNIEISVADEKPLDLEGNENSETKTGDDDELEQAVPPTKSKAKRRKNKKELKCPICGILRNNKYNLKSHINGHTGARPYTCVHCNNTFTNSGNLWKHIELVHKGKKTQQCGHCDKKFQFKSQVKRHELRVHLKLRTYACELCTNAYFTKKELEEHKTQHTAVAAEVSTASNTDTLPMQPNYVCEHCGKSFVKYASMWGHRRVHRQDKRYVCELCHKPMQTAFHLREHMNTHTGQRPHKCSVCSKAFQQKKFLRDHMRLHSDVKAYACHLCEKKFAQAAGLYCHLKTHERIS